MADNAAATDACLGLALATGAARVYREALAAGLVDILHEPLSAAELARRCGYRERPTRRVLAVLAALGVTERTTAGHRLSDLGRALAGGTFRRLGAEAWCQLPRLLATDRPPTAERPEPRDTARALRWLLAPAAELAARSLGMGSRLVGQRILDLGAGSGVWSLALADHDRQATVTAVGAPNALAATAEGAEPKGVADRLRTIGGGDARSAPLEASRYDLVVTHPESPAPDSALFRRARRALRAGGRLLAIDVLAGQAGGDLACALYDLGLALTTECRRVLAPRELSGLLTRAGFTEPELVPLDVPPYALGMMVAERR